jgi:hypothetical protein
MGRDETERSRVDPPLAVRRDIIEANNSIGAVVLQQNHGPRRGRGLVSDVSAGDDQSPASVTHGPPYSTPMWNDGRDVESLVQAKDSAAIGVGEKQSQVSIPNRRFEQPKSRFKHLMHPTLIILRALARTRNR